jgi:NlpC/P60 family putative phage cell wall peptidase
MQNLDPPIITEEGLAIVAEARRWMGTPFRHQAGLRGVGCDCGGLVRGVGEACEVLRIANDVWARHGNYGRTPNPRRMRRSLEFFLREIPLSATRVGDIFWMQWRPDLPMHLAILAALDGRATLIHATSEMGRVVEHGLTREWRSRIASVWRYPGVPDGA